MCLFLAVWKFLREKCDDTSPTTDSAWTNVRRTVSEVAKKEKSRSGVLLKMQLRPWWRHERMSAKAVAVGGLHHSAQRHGRQSPSTCVRRTLAPFSTSASTSSCWARLVVSPRKVYVPAVVPLLQRCEVLGDLRVALLQIKDIPRSCCDSVSLAPAVVRTTHVPVDVHVALALVAASVAPALVPVSSVSVHEVSSTARFSVVS